MTDIEALGADKGGEGSSLRIRLSDIATSKCAGQREEYEISI